MPQLPSKHGSKVAKRVINQKAKQRQSKRLYSTSCKRWRYDREVQLSKQPLCEHCLQYGRTTAANEVDHINGRADREEDYVDSNYQSLCKPCHSTKTFKENKAVGSMQSNVMVYLVSGASGSGKTTHVRNHRNRGDLVIDLDYLYQAFGLLDMYDKPETLTPFVFAAKNAAIARIGESDIRQAWIIQSHVTSVDIQDLSLLHRVQHIQMDTTAEESKRRIIESDRPEHLKASMINHVDRWHEQNTHTP